MKLKILIIAVLNSQQNLIVKPQPPSQVILKPGKEFGETIKKWLKGVPSQERVSRWVATLGGDGAMVLCYLYGKGVADRNVQGPIAPMSDENCKILDSQLKIVEHARALAAARAAVAQTGGAS